VGTALHNWTPTRLSSQAGKTFLITGANSGIGLEAGRVLIGLGGHVILACRNEARADVAAGQLRQVAGNGGRASCVQLDLSDMASIRAGADKVAQLAPKLDALIANAGIMAPPERQETRDGFEMQFGVNHLGHFLLAGLLADNVLASQGRFVSVSSTMHKAGLKRIRFEDPHWESGYRPASAYAQSKLANALFIRELNKRMRKNDKSACGYIAHPGYAATALQTKETKGVVKSLMKVGNTLTAQSAEKGSWPTVLCAADTDAVPGEYYGPTGMFELRGPVGVCKLAKQARDDEAAKKLWAISEELTGFSWTV